MTLKSDELAVVGIFSASGGLLGGSVGWYIYLSQPQLDLHPSSSIAIGAIGGTILGGLIGWGVSKLI